MPSAPPASDLARAHRTQTFDARHPSYVTSPAWRNRNKLYGGGLKRQLVCFSKVNTAVASNISKIAASNSGVQMRNKAIRRTVQCDLFKNLSGPEDRAAFAAPACVPAVA